MANLLASLYGGVTSGVMNSKESSVAIDDVLAILRDIFSKYIATTKPVEQGGNALLVDVDRIAEDVIAGMQGKIRSFVRLVGDGKSNEKFRIGGVLSNKESASRIYQELEKTVSDIVDAIDENIKVESLVYESASIWLKGLGNELKPGKILCKTSVLNSKNGLKENGRDFRKIGRILAAEEKIEVDDFHKQIAEGICDFAKKTQNVGDSDGLDDDSSYDVDVFYERAKHSIRIKRLAQFIEDNMFARARVLTNVTFFNMLRIKNKDKRDFVLFSKNLDYIASLAEDENEAFVVVPYLGNDDVWKMDMSGRFFKMKTLYEYFPIWIDEVADIEEKRREKPLNLSRTVSYRFRINGKVVDHYENKTNSAYLEKVKKLKNAFVQFKNSRYNSDGIFNAHKLARIIFFYMLTSDDAANARKEIEESFENARKNESRDETAKFIEKMLETLEERIYFVESVAKQLGYIIKLPGNIIDKDIVVEVGLDVQTGIIDLNNHEELLVDPGDYNVNWYQYIDVYRLGKSNKKIVQKNEKYKESGIVGRFEITSKFFETNVFSSEERERIIEAERDGSVPLLRIAISNKRSKKIDKGIYFFIDEGKYKNGLNENCVRLAASAIVMDLFARKCAEKLVEKYPNLHAIIGHVFYQNSDVGDGSKIYILSKALDLSLSGVVPTRSQGYEQINGDTENNAKYKKTSFLAALPSVLPLVVHVGDSSGAPEKIGMIVQTSRPVNTGEKEQHLIVARCYTGVFEDGKLRFSLDKVYGEGPFSTDRFDSPDAIKEVVKDMRKRHHGIKDFMILSNGFRTRNIGRSANRNAPHATSSVMDKLNGEIKDANFYFFGWNSMNVVRIGGSAKNGHFEVSNFSLVKDRQAFESENENKRAIFPVYAIGSFKVVGLDGTHGCRPQSVMTTYNAYIENIMSEKGPGVLKVLREKNDPVYKALLAMLLGLHYYEGEKNLTAKTYGQELVPVTDPYWWIGAKDHMKAGEARFKGENNRDVIFSVHGLLCVINNFSKAASSDLPVCAENPGVQAGDG